MKKVWALLLTDVDYGHDKGWDSEQAMLLDPEKPIHGFSDNGGEPDGDTWFVWPVNPNDPDVRAAVGAGAMLVEGWEAHYDASLFPGAHNPWAGVDSDSIAFFENFGDARASELACQNYPVSAAQLIAPTHKTEKFRAKRKEIEIKATVYGHSLFGNEFNPSIIKPSQFDPRDDYIIKINVNLAKISILTINPGREEKMIHPTLQAVRSIAVDDYVALVFTLGRLFEQQGSGTRYVTDYVVLWRILTQDTYGTFLAMRPSPQAELQLIFNSTWVGQAAALGKAEYAIARVAFEILETQLR